MNIKDNNDGTDNIHSSDTANMSVRIVYSKRLAFNKY